MTKSLKCTVCGNAAPAPAGMDAARFVCPACAHAATITDAPDGPATIASPELFAQTVIVKTDAAAAAAAEPAVPLRFGHYEIVEEIARGGVGVVYKARQRGLERLVALKVLQLGMAASGEQVQRFLHEARAAAKLQHPNIVPIHDFGVEDGQHYFTMDYIEGESLADMVARGPLQPRDALAIIEQVAAALHYAHQQGVIHRDIKPGNILLDKSGRVKVTDFGLAKEVESGEMHLTMTGQVMGTPRYMSPEQASGKTSEADARSDVFSLGVTLYETLTGRPAFEADNVVAMLQKVLTFDPPPPQKLNSKVHRDVETICLKAIEKTPERRYQTALDMSQDIQRFLGGEPIEAKAVGPLQRLARRLRKHALVLAIYAAVLFITISLIVLALHARPSLVHLKVETPGAVAKLNGLPLTPDELRQGKSLRAGDYRVRVEAEPLYEPFETDLSTRPGESRSMTVTLKRRVGTLRVETDPADAGVTITDAHEYRATFQGPTIEQILPTGDYLLFAHKDNYLAQDASVSLAANALRRFAFRLLPIRLWTTPTGGSVLSVPVVGDFAGDGTRDVVAGDDAGRVYCLSGRDGIALWVFRAKDAVQAPLSKADLDGDKLPDVIFGSTDHFVYALRGRTGTLLWSYETKGPIYGPALLRDLNGDGIPEVVVGSEDGNVYALAGRTGELLWRFDTHGRIESCLAWARQADQDLLLVGNLDKALYALAPAKGELLWKLPVGEALHYPPRLEDLERHGQLTALLPVPKSAADARSMVAVSLATHEIVARGDVFPLWVDLNGDGRPEKIEASATGTVCYAADGTNVLWRIPHVVVTPSFARVDQDEYLDLVMNSGPDQLLCLSGRTGQPIGRLTLHAATGRGFSLEDIDADNVPDVVVGVGRAVECFSWVGGRKRWEDHPPAYLDARFVVDGQRVVTKTIGGQIACYDAGQPVPLWKVETSPQPSPYAALAVGAGLVIDADAHTRRLAAYRVADGERAWSAILPGAADAAIGTPGVGGDAVWVGDGESGFYCFGLADGKPRWQVSLPQVTAPAVGSGDWLWVADGTGALRCLAAADGKERWRFPVSDPFPVAPVLHDIDGDGTLDVVAYSDNGTVYALNGLTGKPLWQRQIVTARTRSRTGVVLADVDGDGVPEGIVVTPGGEAVCFDLRQGEPRWHVTLGEQVLGLPLVADLNADGVPDVAVGTMRRRVRCLSGRDGRDLWSYELGAQVRFAGPVAVPNPQATNAAPRVFVGTGPPDNGIYCLSGDAPRAGTPDWSGPWKLLTTVR